MQIFTKFKVDEYAVEPPRPEHENLAKELEAKGEHELAGWVRDLENDRVRLDATMNRIASTDRVLTKLWLAVLVVLTIHLAVAVTGVFR